MKKTLLILGMFMLTLGTAYSQYFIVNKVGTTSDYNFNGTTGVTTLLAGSGTTAINDVLSASTSLPFAFSLFGNPVTSFKASDNGYITFDATATTSNPNHVTLPSTTAP